MTDRRVAVVTGGNKGLGKETAWQLAHRGMTVFLGARDPERGAAAARELNASGATVVAVPLDVTDADSVQAVAARLREDYGRLDVLVNNAGTVIACPVEDLTTVELRQTFEVNVFGAVTVVHAMLPLLKNSAAPRIVNVSSTTASLSLTSGGTDFGGDAGHRSAYSSSKAALNMLTVHYAQAFQRDSGLAHIKINSATPGYTATELTGYRGRTVADGARIIVELAMLPDDGPTGGFFNDQGPVPW
ncbi:SDR family oxidoreductase [Amycolatopsis taiwanensis]|uniref:SDR family oxidoreductase n=1 Tax=Amycolatopsis taiwanensis TaxID=342230 RepID=UPI0004819063|nr:SDR family oxidoreductase [Amycolatopsis taiwanensis]